MIPIWIIDELNRKQEEERRREEKKRERLELPITRPERPDSGPAPESTPQGGTIVIDLWPD